MEYHSGICICFIDLSKAYDSVNRKALIVLNMVLVEQLYSGRWCQLRLEDEVSGRFEVKTGVRQGCALSSILFNCYIDNIVRETMEAIAGGIYIDYNSNGLFFTYQDTAEGSETIQEV